MIVPVSETDGGAEANCATKRAVMLAPIVPGPAASTYVVPLGCPFAYVVDLSVATAIDAPAAAMVKPDAALAYDPPAANVPVAATMLPPACFMLDARIVVGAPAVVPATSTFSPTNGSGPEIDVLPEVVTETCRPSAVCKKKFEDDWNAVTAPTYETEDADVPPPVVGGSAEDPPPPPPPPHAVRADAMSNAGIDTRFRGEQDIMVTLFIKEGGSTITISERIHNVLPARYVRPLGIGKECADNRPGLGGPNMS